MADQEQKPSRRVPWVDHPTPSSGGDAHGAERHPRIDRDDVDDTETLPEKGASTHEGAHDVPQADGAKSGEDYGERDIGKSIERSDREPD